MIEISSGFNNDQHSCKAIQVCR